MEFNFDSDQLSIQMVSGEYMSKSLYFTSGAAMCHDNYSD